MRGFLVRKRFEEVRNVISNDTAGGHFDDTINENELIFSNEKVKEVYNREGPYHIPDLTDPDEKRFRKMGPYRLLSGAIYFGEWNEDLTKREGKGR